MFTAVLLTRLAASDHRSTVKLSMDKCGSCTITIILMLLPGKRYQDVYGMLRAFNGYCMLTHCDVLSPSALCAGQPSNPTISRTQNGSALTDPVVFGVNQTVSIWCRAENVNTSRKLQGLFWRDNNDARLRAKGHRDNPSQDVYMERVAGNKDVYTPTWIRVLHINRIQTSYAGVYTCTANYNKFLLNATVEIQVSCECEVFNCTKTQVWPI